MAQVRAVQFSIERQDEIENISAVHVTDPTLHHRNTVRANSLLDSRFGAINRFQPCGTCGRTLATCPSHPGHITLPVPLPHVSFKTILMQLLNVVCCNCSCLLATPQEKQKIANGPKRLAVLYNYFKKRRQQHVIVCPNPECQWPQPTTELSEPYFIHRWDTALIDSLVSAGELPADLVQVCYAQSFNNVDAVYLLKSIPPKDLEYLRFSPQKSHPADMMLRFLIVPGVAVRPTLQHGDGSKRQTYNELTKVLACITKYVTQINASCQAAHFDFAQMNNNLLPLDAGVGWSPALDNQIKSLYANISAYLNPHKANIPGFKMRPYDAKLHALKNSNLLAPLQGGKLGRYRQNVQGKRVNHCARTVVTPFPEGDIDEARVPKIIAEALCVPERVSKYSLAHHQALLAQGVYKVVIPDADNDPRMLIEINDKNRNTFVLQVGYTVGRSLRTSDYVLMNRQPSLHKVSMMAHRAVVALDGNKTFGINTDTLPPYNGDCDGDEFNLHVMQCLPATVELEELMAVSNNMIHPGGNRPAVGMIQDGIVAAWWLTSPNTWLTKADMMMLLQHARYDPHAPPTEPMTSLVIRKQWSAADLPPPTLFKPHELWSGKQLVSMLLPPNLNIFRAGNLVSDTASQPGTRDELIISNGHMLVGQLCKRTMGAVAHGLTHYIALYNGYGAACRFLSDISRVCGIYFERVGFSMGLDDCKPRDPSLQTHFKRMIDDVEHAFETEVRSRAKRMRSLCGTDVDLQSRTTKAYEVAAVATVKTVLDTTGKLMSLAPQNAVQIMTVDAGSKGSSFNSSQIIGCLGQTFVDGGRPSSLNPGRGLPSSRLASQPEDQEKTRRLLQSAGFISRPYSMGLNVEQFAMHAMGGREGLIDTARKTKVTGYLQRRLVKALETLTCAYDLTVRNSRQSVFNIKFGNDGYESSRLLQLNKLDLICASNTQLREVCAHDRAIFTWNDLARVRDSLRASRMHGLQPSLATNAAVPFNLETLIPSSANVVTLTCKCFSADELLDPMLVEAMRRFACDVLEAPAAAHVMWFVNSKTRYCNACLLQLLEDMQRLHQRALLQPGESIGALAATSLGEPATQLTLNTFHFSGTSNDGITYGVPRMCEIIDAKVDINSPRMWLPLAPGTTREQAQVVADSLVETMLLACLVESQVIDDLPGSVRLSNMAFLDEYRALYLRYALRFKCNPKYNIVRIVNQLQRAVGQTALVLTDADAPNDVYVLIVRDERELSKAAVKATSGHANRANKRHARPVTLATDDTDALVDVPLHALCAHSVELLPRQVTVQEVLEANHAGEFMAKLQLTCLVSGTRGIRGVTVRNQPYALINKTDGSIVHEDRLFLDVRGSMLEEVHHVPFVDLSNVVTNSVSEVYRLLGIDAAERTLFHEIRTCFEVGGARPDDRLIALLASVITHWGIVLPINRYGLNRLDGHSVIAKICFEEVVEQLLGAAAFGVHDPLLGPSETIMFGKLTCSGTGMPGIICSANNQTIEDKIVVSVLPECPWFVAPALSEEPKTSTLAESLNALLATPAPQAHAFRPSSPCAEEGDFCPTSPTS